MQTSEHHTCWMGNWGKRKVKRACRERDDGGMEVLNDKGIAFVRRGLHYR